MSVNILLDWHKKTVRLIKDGEEIRGTLHVLPDRIMVKSTGYIKIHSGI